MKQPSNIGIAVNDAQGYNIYNHDFDTMKEAREWVKDCGKSKDFWNRLNETNDGYTQVHTIQLIKNDEIMQDWFPSF